jgi:hypothetical protein
MPKVTACEDIIMNTRILLFVATVAISVIGSTVALADETVYPSSPLTCAQANGELAQPIAAHTLQRTDDAAGGTHRAKADTVARSDS